MVYKFNSPQHLFSWVEGLQSLPRTGRPEMRSSEDTGTSDIQFTLSTSLENAYDVLRETQFDPRRTDILQANILEMKHSTMFSDEGYELDIAEHLSGSDRVWLKPRKNRKPTRIIDDVLIIDGAYNCGRDAETSKNIGIDILTAIYRRNVIPRKIVVVYGGLGIRNGKENGYLVSIDVSFSDLNGIAKLLHPSAFRRVYFRLLEIYPDLNRGYGRPYNGSTSKGYISVDNIYNIWYDKEEFERQIDKFLGLTEKK